jgi:polyisoprenoid-binding protein YceI
MTPTNTIPDYVAGVWAIDPVHSEVSFTVRHLMVTKVRGRFTRFSGEIVTAPDPLESSVSATIDVASVDTNHDQRDSHLRSADFFDVETYPTMTYRSTGVRPDRNAFMVEGELTLKGVTRRVQLQLSLNGIAPYMEGGTVAGFSAAGNVNRRDFDVNFHAVLDGGGVVVGDEVTLNLEIEAVLTRPEQDDKGQ